MCLQGVNCFLDGIGVTDEPPPATLCSALIIDDGLPARKHRNNIYNPNFNFAGAAFGRHAHFGTVCSMDFAGSYTERAQSPAETLVARNF